MFKWHRRRATTKIPFSSLFRSLAFSGSELNVFREMRSVSCMKNPFFHLLKSSCWWKLQSELCNLSTNKTDSVTHCNKMEFSPLLHSIHRGARVYVSLCVSSIYFEENPLSSSHFASDEIVSSSVEWETEISWVVKKERRTKWMSESLWYSVVLIINGASA